jgi:hypothetical protein
MLAKAKNDHANIKTTLLMNLLPGKKYGIPSRNFLKKMFCGKKVTKLPDLTVIKTYTCNMFCTVMLPRVL